MTRLVYKIDSIVTATLGSFTASLFPARYEQTAVDDRDEWPWAWCGLGFVTFRIGSGQVTKRVTARCQGDTTEPGPLMSGLMFREMNAAMIRRLADHGLAVPSIEWDIQFASPNSQDERDLIPF